MPPPQRTPLATLDWSRFEPSAVSPRLLHIAKTTALIESRAHAYGAYLRGAFDRRPRWLRRIQTWSEEEALHGAVLRRWLMLADPGFDFDGAMHDYERTVPYRTEAVSSIRGSIAAELVARCTVEALAAAFYRAVADASAEPLLAAICQNLAADEARHYTMFLRMLREEVRAHGDPAASRRLVDRQRVVHMARRIAEIPDPQILGASACARPAMPFRWWRETRYLAEVASITRPTHVRFGWRLLTRVVRPG